MAHSTGFSGRLASAVVGPAGMSQTAPRLVGPTAAASALPLSGPVALEPAKRRGALSRFLDSDDEEKGPSSTQVDSGRPQDPTPAAARPPDAAAAALVPPAAAAPAAPVSVTGKMSFAQRAAELRRKALGDSQKPPPN